MTTPADELFDRSFDQVRRGDVRGALGSLLDTLAVDPAHQGALDSAARICRMLGAPEDAQLFEDLATRPEDAETWFGLGWRLVDQDRPDVGSTLLEQALRRDPSNHDFRRELAFARFLKHDYAGCRTALAPLDDEPDLSETERLDVIMLDAEAALYVGDPSSAARALHTADEMVPDDVQQQRLDALAQMLGRARHVAQLSSCGLREWHFIQHAGVILKTAGGHFETGEFAGRFGLLSLRLDMVAFLLQRLLHLLERLDHPVDMVISASDMAAPLAHGLAQRAGLALSDEPTDEHVGSALLVAANGAEYAPWVARLSQHASDLSLFALNLDWERGTPVCPEIVGVLARRVVLPWETTFALGEGGGEARQVPGDDRPPEEIGAALVEAMEALPDDGGQARNEFEQIYAPLAEELVLGNDQRYPHRRQFTHHSPCRPPHTSDDGPGRDAGGGADGTGPDEPADAGWTDSGWVEDEIS